MTLTPEQIDSLLQAIEVFLYTAGFGLLLRGLKT